MSDKKSGWTNQEFDSTVFMLFTLCLFGAYIYACYKSEDFRTAGVSGDLLLIFSAVFSAMGNHFFNKSRRQNGDAPPQGDQNK